MLASPPGPHTTSMALPTWWQVSGEDMDFSPLWASVEPPWQGGEGGPGWRGPDLREELEPPLTCRLDPPRLVARWSVAREAGGEHGVLATSGGPPPHHQPRRARGGLRQDHLRLVRLPQDTHPRPGPQGQG